MTLPRLPHWKLKPTAASARCNSRSGNEVCLLSRGHDGPHVAEGYTWRDTEPFVTDNFNGRLEWRPVPWAEGYRIVNPQGHTIGAAYFSTDPCIYFDARGNAELMAAAPRLLKCLEDLMGDYYWSTRHKDGGYAEEHPITPAKRLVDELKEKLQ